MTFSYTIFYFIKFNQYSFKALPIKYHFLPCVNFISTTGREIAGSKLITDILDITLIDCSWLLSNNTWTDCMRGLKKKGGSGDPENLKSSSIFMVKLPELCRKTYLSLEPSCKKFLEPYMNWTGGG